MQSALYHQKLGCYVPSIAYEDPLSWCSHLLGTNLGHLHIHRAPPISYHDICIRVRWRSLKLRRKSNQKCLVKGHWINMYEQSIQVSGHRTCMRKRVACHALKDGHPSNNVSHNQSCEELLFGRHITLPEVFFIDVRHELQTYELSEFLWWLLPPSWIRIYYGRCHVRFYDEVGWACKNPCHLIHGANAR